MADLSDIERKLNSKGLLQCSALVLQDDACLVIESVTPDDPSVRDFFYAWMMENMHGDDGFYRLSRKSGGVHVVNMDDQVHIPEMPSMSERDIGEKLAGLPSGSVCMIFHEHLTPASAPKQEEGVRFFMATFEGDDGSRFEFHVEMISWELSSLSLYAMDAVGDAAKAAHSMLEDLSGIALTSLSRNGAHRTCDSTSMQMVDATPASRLSFMARSIIRDSLDVSGKRSPVLRGILSSPCLVSCMVNTDGKICGVFRSDI